MATLPLLPVSKTTSLSKPGLFPFHKVPKLPSVSIKTEYPFVAVEAPPNLNRKTKYATPLTVLFKTNTEFGPVIPVL